MRRTTTIVLAMSTLTFSGAAVAQNEFEPQLRAMFEDQIRPILSQPVVLETLAAQNADHAGLTDADITAMDNDWRQAVEAGGGDVIDDVLSRELSAYLQQVQSDSDGMITEVFVMDNRGLNVGQSAVTSDYMQGDEAKWQETFLVGPDAVFVDELEFDESSDAFQTQVSGTIVDPETGEAIGAITVGVNVESLL